MDINRLKDQFSNPPSKYTYAPFWFLNHDLTDEELKWQINEMNNNGVKGFIMHPRHGLITEYLSEAWFDRIETCIKEADKLGMKAYLYDENNWPSGPVDGILLTENPEYRMAGCFATQKFPIAGGKKLKQKLDTRDGLIAAVAVPMEKGVLVGLPDSAVLLDSFVEDGVLVWEAPDDAAKWIVFIFAKVIQRGTTFFDGYLDTLNKDAVAKFIDMTHKRYTERFSKYFGGTVDGIFTDEPMMNGLASEGIPFTKEMPSAFAWRHGYDFYSVLPAMFADAGPETAQLRCDYYDNATNMYQQAYFKQIYDYCDPLRLNTIGHVLYEGELHQCTRYQGDFFKTMEYMHFAGCDFLMEMTWPDQNKPYDLNNLVGPKLASSAGHLFQKPRVMSECFGVASGWHIDMRTLKWMTDWQVALGINLLQPHAFYYSIQGQRKWECPPGEFYQSSFWPYYKYLADYTARLCSIFTGAEHVADVAVLNPSRSMWAALAPEITPESEKIVRGFNQVTSALLKSGYDFDIIPEEELLNCDYELSHLPSGEDYQVLVIPYVTTLLAETADFISNCIERGTNVVLVGDSTLGCVMDSDGEWTEHDWSSDLFLDMFGMDFSAEAGKLVSRGVTDGCDSAVMISKANEMDDDQLASVFTSVFPELFEPDVAIKDKKNNNIADIIHNHYMHGENDFYMFVNTSRDKAYSAKVSIDAIGVPSIWNAETGDVTALTSYDYDGERTLFNLDFQPCESYVISVTTVSASDETVELASEPAYGKIIELANEWEFSTDKQNALPLADWQFSMTNYGKGDWGHATNIYTTTFECEAELSDARLVIDGLLTEKIWRQSTPIHTEITLNGDVVNGFARGEYIDHYIMEADVLPLIKRGKNILQIRCNTQLAPAGNLSNPAYIVGNFELRKQGSNYRIVPAASSIKTGDWGEQGYPFYSGIATYRQMVSIPRTSKRVYLRMDAPGDMAEVRVNGEFAAVLPWEPWIADITDLVKTGDNEIIINVANSMANIFMMQPKPSGILGKVEIAIAK